MIVTLDIANDETQQKSVVQRRQFVLIGQFVGCRDQGAQGDVCRYVALVKAPFVKDGEQRVENRGIGLEDLIKESDFRFWQLQVRNPLIAALLKGAQAKRTEEFFGSRKFGQ